MSPLHFSARGTNQVALSSVAQRGGIVGNKRLFSSAVSTHHHCCSQTAPPASSSCSPGASQRARAASTQEVDLQVRNQTNMFQRKSPIWFFFWSQLNPPKHTHAVHFSMSAGSFCPRRDNLSEGRFRQDYTCRTLCLPPFTPRSSPCPGARPGPEEASLRFPAGDASTGELESLQLEGQQRTSPSLWSCESRSGQRKREDSDN